MTTINPRLFTVAELADRWGVSYETVRRYIRKGALPALHVGPTRLLRIPLQTVVTFESYTHFTTSADN